MVASTPRHLIEGGPEAHVDTWHATVVDSASGLNRASPFSGNSSSLISIVTVYFVVGLRFRVSLASPYGHSGSRSSSTYWPDRSSSACDKSFCCSKVGFTSLEWRGGVCANADQQYAYAQSTHTCASLQDFQCRRPAHAMPQTYAHGQAPTSTEKLSAPSLTAFV